MTGLQDNLLKKTFAVQEQLTNAQNVAFEGYNPDLCKLLKRIQPQGNANASLVY